MKDILPVKNAIALMHIMGGWWRWALVSEWRPAGLSVCLYLLIFLCTIKSRSSLLAPVHPGGPGKKAVVVVMHMMRRSSLPAQSRRS